MKDLQLEDSLKTKRRPSQFDDEIMKGIKEAVCKMDFIENKLISSDHKRKQMELELQQALELPFYQEQGKIALNILVKDAQRYLTRETYQKLQGDLIYAEGQLATLDPKTVGKQRSFTAIHKIPQKSLQAIAAVSIQKFSEGQYRDALALFTFLTLLNPNDATYWIGAGLAAQYDFQDLLALENYNIALTILPESLEALLFAAELYLKLGMKSECATYTTSAKRCLETKDPQQELRQLLKDIEISLNY